jgi:hypothetical protein
MSKMYRNLFIQHRTTIGKNGRVLLLALTMRLVAARLAAPPMLCYNQAGTGTTAHAVGVALGDNAARIAGEVPRS